MVQMAFTPEVFAAIIGGIFVVLAAFITGVFNLRTARFQSYPATTSQPKPTEAVQPSAARPAEKKPFLGGIWRLGVYLLPMAVYFVIYFETLHNISIVSTGPWQMHSTYQGIYVQAVADAYARDGNDALAAERLSYLCQSDGGLEAAFAEAEARYGGGPALATNLDRLRALVDEGKVVEEPRVPVCNYEPMTSPTDVSNVMSIIMYAFVGIILGFIGIERAVSRRGIQAGVFLGAALVWVTNAIVRDFLGVSEARLLGLLAGFLFLCTVELFISDAIRSKVI